MQGIINNKNKALLKSTKFLTRNPVNLKFKDTMLVNPILGGELTTVEKLITNIFPVLDKISSDKENGLKSTTDYNKLLSKRSKKNINNQKVNKTSNFKYEVAYDGKYLPNNFLVNDLDGKKSIDIIPFDLTKDTFIKRLIHSQSAGENISKPKCYTTLQDYEKESKEKEKNKVNKLNDKSKDKEKESDETYLSICDKLEKHLFNPEVNFFDYFLEKQSKIAMNRSDKVSSHQKLLERMLNFTNIEGYTSQDSKFVANFSFLDQYNYKLHREYTIYPLERNPSNTDYILEKEYNFADTVLPNLQKQFLNDASANLSSLNTLKANFYTQTKRVCIIPTKMEYPYYPIKSNFHESILLKKILDNDDKRYVNPKNTINITKLDLPKEYISNAFSEYVNEIKKNRNSKYSINISDLSVGNKKNTNTNSDFDSLETIISEVLKNQDTVFKEFTEKRVPQIKERDGVVYNIRTCKLFALESEVIKRLFSELVEKDPITKFRVNLEQNLYEDLFINYDLLRKLSKTRENLENRHQLGIFYFNGFAVVSMYSRPTFGKVENTVKHLDCSKAYNLNIDYVNRKFANEQDVKDFIDLVHIYTLSDSREIEAIKDLHYMI